MALQNQFPAIIFLRAAHYVRSTRKDTKQEDVELDTKAESVRFNDRDQYSRVSEVPR